ncbi:MAG TPA: hypothetical protein VF665_10885 [Longimicrobium sp.]|jgi:hypothetical protein|uniref:hypothetical protein n=1 Tax=Longimicrobium sp. TaxID=2029185 RepID=UPI002EDA537E
MKRLVFLALAALAAASESAAQISVVSSTVEERQAAPGASYSGTVRVRNAGGDARTARVSAADYRFLADGRTFYDAPGSTPRSNAPWVRFSPSQLTLAPGEEATVAYTVTVPAGGDVRGSYWSVLLVETMDPASVSAARTGRLGLTPVIRYAVQLATHVGEAERRVALQGARVTGPGRAPALEMDIMNTGEQADRLELRMDLFRADGAPAGQRSSTRGLVYPGSSIHQAFDLRGLAPGTYRAMVTVDTGSDDVFGAEYTIRI